MLNASGTHPGLYRPEFEHDACGVAFVAHLHGRPSHAMVEMGLASLCQLEHRGAKGADPATGDGAGLLVQVPDRFLRSRLDVELPAPGAYATGIAFLPSGPGEADAACARFDELAAEEGLSVRAWRPVPVEAGLPGSAAREVMPVFRQVVVAGRPGRAGWPWTGGPTWPATGPSTRSPASTLRPCRPGRWFTRGC